MKNDLIRIAALSFLTGAVFALGMTRGVEMLDAGQFGLAIFYALGIAVVVVNLVVQTWLVLKPRKEG